MRRRIGQPPVVKRVQKGIESAGFRGAVLSEQEQRIGHFHAELERYLAAAG